MARKITYDDKISLTTSALPRANKCTDDDLNEIKQVVNNNADELDENTTAIETLQQLIEDRSNYSTTEKQIGTWINNKPVYQKVVSATTNSTENQWKAITSGLNISKIIRYSGNIEADKNKPLPFSSQYQQLWLQINNGNLEVAVAGASFLGKNIELLIEYTKTTD